ncbi:MAG: xanthine dehydrogenase family protein molybdopterin-binding subunit, partial [Sinobacteraceae bacterium]|nr:xanthine dehydrogenase family protein molybdopterin-binding subunit [Nevskiaceae bacterium]
MRLTTIAGAGLTVGAWLPARVCSAGEKASARVSSLVTPFVRVDPDNTVTVIIKHVEMGQGVWTGLPAVVADELDASWDQMRIESAPAQVPQYGNLQFDPKGNMQGTGGSTSMANSWDQLRQAGAAARAMLVQAAAARWHVPSEQIAVSEGVISHPSGKHASFGELAASAGKLPVPVDVKLKVAAQFKYIGRDKLPRLDSRAKSTGTQQFAIDLMLADMMTAVLLRPPR